MNGDIEQTKSAISKAIELLGGPVALARAVGARYQLVQKWLKTGRVAEAWLEPISRATDGKVPPHEVRPDLARIFKGGRDHEAA